MHICSLQVAAAEGVYLGRLFNDFEMPSSRALMNAHTVPRDGSGEDVVSASDTPSIIISARDEADDIERRVCA